jgi:DNA (cytosine-5)-methyltransferase 1
MAIRARSVFSSRKSLLFSSALAKGKLRPASANGRGIYETPDFELSRPPKAAGQIEFTIRANRVEGGQWIAEATWHSPSQHLLGDGQYPNKLSHRFASRSEAVEHALNRGLRQVRQQLGGLASTPAWSAKVESLQTWAADAVFQVREQDETLPLHGRTIIDICAGGLGGFGLGLASLGAKVQLAVEIDPKARATYERNVRPAEVHDDLCTLDGNKLSCDVLTVGLMCTAFSKAGKRKGFADSQLADVYLHTLRLLREIDAKIIIIECARQLLTQDDGRDGATVREVLMKAGYRVQHRTLNAAGFGVPQSRERSFIVATRMGLPVDDVLGYVFPQEQAPTATVEDILDPGIPATIADSEIEFHTKEPTKRSDELVEVGLIDGKDCQGYRVYSPKGIGTTMTASGGGRARCTGAYRVKGGARALTPREAGRMQGLPEWAAHHPVATHALRHAGNAVAVPLARELGRQLAAHLASRT